MKKIVLAGLLLAGCAGQTSPTTAQIESAVAPIAKAAAAAIPGVGNTLSAVASVACAAQAAANAGGNSDVSKIAGLFCTW